MSDFGFRFGGIARLYGAAGLERLRSAHVMVVGIGGVGSWAAEALARSGVGRLTLVDLDEICVSNVNRQLHALDGTVGRAKVEVMAERARGISPEATVEAVLEFFTAENAARLLGIDPPGANARVASETRDFPADSGTPPMILQKPIRGLSESAGDPGNFMKPDFVVDAIDSMANKVRLIALCHGAGIPLIVCGGAGGRRDPTAVRVADLGAATHDRLLAEVRKRLRKEHGFSRDGKIFGVDCVYSAEPQVFPAAAGTVCATREGDDGESLRLNCASGFGSATFVTGAFGFAAAARVVGRLAAA